MDFIPTDQKSLLFLGLILSLALFMACDPGGEELAPYPLDSENWQGFLVVDGDTSDLSATFVQQGAPWQSERTNESGIGGTFTEWPVIGTLSNREWIEAEFAGFVSAPVSDTALDVLLQCSTFIDADSIWAGLSGTIDSLITGSWFVWQSPAGINELVEEGQFQLAEAE